MNYKMIQIIAELIELYGTEDEFWKEYRIIQSRLFPGSNKI